MSFQQQRWRLAAGVAALAVFLGTIVGIATPAHADVTLDNAFAQLTFDYTNHENINPALGPDCTDTGNPCAGKSQGDIVLFENVATVAGTSVDAVVTTSFVSAGATINRYQVGADSGIENVDFRVNVGTTGAGQYVEFNFAFFVAGTYGTGGQSQVTFRNVQLTGQDIDFSQFNNFSDIEAYTLADNTRLTPTPPSPAFPADVSFQGQSGTGTDDPEDQAVVTYGEFDDTSVQLGRSAAGGTDNFFSLHWAALSFSPSLPITVGQDYTLDYDAQGGTGAPASQTDNLGSQFNLQSGVPTRPGYTFDGWNTEIDGSGTDYSPSDQFTMPYQGDILYAQWTPNAIVSLTYQGAGATGGTTPSQSGAEGTDVTVQPNGFTWPGHTFTGWNTAENGSGTAYDPSDPFTLPPGGDVLYAQWTTNEVVSLTYQGNGATGGSTASQSGPSGTDVTVQPDGFTWPGHTFTGWNTAADGSGTSYPPGSAFTLPPGGGVLYAQWTTTDAVPQLQKPTEPIVLPPTLKPDGITLIVNGVHVTTAGERVRVKVDCGPLGRLGVRGDFRYCRVIKRSNGRVYVQTFGTPTRVKVTLWAPAADGYAKYKRIKIYRVR